MEILHERYESPIELYFGICAAITLARSSLRLVAQHSLANFRYDFAVFHSVQKVEHIILALVECDGKEFHSTDAQLANDRRKEVTAGEAGTFVVRYAGQAIMQDAMGCAENLHGIIQRVWGIP
jgi:very-short-patch-repair endonuclease